MQHKISSTSDIINVASKGILAIFINASVAINFLSLMPSEPHTVNISDIKSLEVSLLWQIISCKVKSVPHIFTSPKGF